MDIVERLRAWSEIDPSASQDLNEAANEIERLQEEIVDLKYKEAYFSRAYMAARRMLDERSIHMDYFLSRENYESEVKEKNNDAGRATKRK